MCDLDGLTPRIFKFKSAISSHLFHPNVYDKCQRVSSCPLPAKQIK